MKKICALLLAALLSTAAGCGVMLEPDEAEESIQVIAMDTAMTFTAYGVNSTKADYAAEEEVYRLEPCCPVPTGTARLPSSTARAPQWWIRSCGT